MLQKWKMLKIRPFTRLASCSSRFTAIRSISICIVGSGPAGFYCAQHLLKIIPKCTVDIYEKLPVPYGLVRYGVAPDHPEVKNVINTFSKTGSDSRFKFVGNAKLGLDIKLKELQEAYHVVVLSYGADQDVKLKIPGEELSNIIPARRFVGWYNGLPEDSDLKVDLNSENVAIIGQGNVAIDVARILLKSVDELKNTDIAQHALNKLSESKVKNVHLIGRRGPLQVAFTIKEFREMLKLPGVGTIIDRNLFNGIESTIENLPRPRKRLTELLLKTAEECSEASLKSKKFIISFLRSPEKFFGNNSVIGANLMVNKFNTPFEISPEEQKMESTGEIENLNCGLVLRSIGYSSSKEDPDIAFQKSNCIGTARVMPGVYSAGWLSTGPTGVILSTMNNAFNTANLIAEDIKNKVVHTKVKKPGFRMTGPLIRSRGIQTISWKGWNKIDEVEVNRGKKRNKPREKIVIIDEMMEIGYL